MLQHISHIQKTTRIQKITEEWRLYTLHSNYFRRWNTKNLKINVILPFTSFRKFFWASSSTRYSSFSTITSFVSLCVTLYTWPKKPLPSNSPFTRSDARKIRWLLGSTRNDLVRERSHISRVGGDLFTNKLLHTVCFIINAYVEKIKNHIKLSQCDDTQYKKISHTSKHRQCKHFVSASGLLKSVNTAWQNNVAIWLRSTILPEMVNIIIPTKSWISVLFIALICCNTVNKSDYIFFSPQKQMVNWRTNVLTNKRHFGSLLLGLFVHCTKFKIKFRTCFRDTIHPHPQGNE